MGQKKGRKKFSQEVLKGGAASKGLPVRDVSPCAVCPSRKYPLRFWDDGSTITLDLLRQWRRRQ